MAINHKFAIINHKSYIVYFVLVLVLASCANRGIGPQGGPKDSIPPVALKAEPELGTLEFHGKRIEITFNEYIQLNDLASNLLMSPPQQTPPDVKARGKRLIVLFQDTLRDSTTYTIDFGDAVCDYTEKNPIHGFNFYFSTGTEIDTLEYIGRVFNAENLNPLSGISVGIHRDMADSAFETQPFLRLARTDSAGVFRIGNIHPGTYRLYAVNDISRDYRLTVSEALAFADEPIHVTAHTHAPQPKDSTALPALPDSLPALPDSLHALPAPRSPLHAHHAPLPVLFLFEEAQQKLYLQRTQREQQHFIQLIFSSAPDSLLSWRVLPPSAVDSTHNDSAWLNPTPYIFARPSLHRDTMTFWLTDSLAILQDTILLETRYRRTDSLYQLEWFIDTLRAVYRAPRLNSKAQEAKAREERNRRLTLKTNARTAFEIYDTLRLTCTTPLTSILRDSIHLMEKKDTSFIPVPFTIAPYDTLPMELLFMADLQPGTQYELRLDSGALHDVYGTTHIKANYPLKVKTKEDYSTLTVLLTPFNARARIQVLNNKDIVVREKPASETGTLFEYLKPDSYYLRLYLDLNGDGKWTTGNWKHKQQPEPVYYFPEKIQTKSNWDFEQAWDYTAVPQTEAKPKELIKASAAKKK